MPLVSEGESFAVKSYQSFRLLANGLFLIVQFSLKHFALTGSKLSRKRFTYSNQYFLKLNQHDLWGFCSEDSTTRPWRDFGNRMP
jgi:hypothetical protein